MSFPQFGNLVAETVGVLSVAERAEMHGALVADIIGDVCDADLCGTDVMVGSARWGITVERVLWLRASALAVGGGA